MWVFDQPRGRATSPIVALLLVAATLTASPATAKTIHKTVPTKLVLSATRAADGTITATATFTSPNPRCLSAKRFPGMSRTPVPRLYVGGGLEWGGPSGYPGDPAGKDGDTLSGLTPYIFPISPAGKSPYVWQTIYPGSQVVQVENQFNPSLPHYYQSTVAAASAMGLSGYAGGGKLGSLGRDYKVKYHQGGNRIVLACRPTKDEHETFVF